jgi:NAD(P)-dependent dehydrogenase (short-subunit alcohol dehydrogenase family)
MSVLENQVAVVTGASSGIGEAIALRLVGHGAVVCLVAKSAEGLERVAALARGGRGKGQCYPADLAVEADIQRLRDSLERDFGQIDLVIHSAGVIALAPLQQAAIEDLDRQFRINVRAPYLLTQQLLPLLKPRRGQIVFINSSVGLNARGGVGQYASTKYGLRAIADSLREEVNQEGIRVLSIFLGRTATPMQAAVHRMEGKAYDPDRLVQPEDVAAMVVAAVSLPRTAEVTDISIRPMRKPAAGGE